jgi:hypothetical protein
MLKVYGDKLNNKKEGVTSLLFVLAIGLVLVVMVAGIAALTIREQQQASNTELSNRALQSAEAGIKKAVQLLDANPAYKKSDCAPGSDFSGSNLNLGADQSISCVVVESVFQGDYEGYLKSNESQQFFAGPSITNSTTSPSYLRLSWNNPSLSDTSNPIFDTATNKVYPIVEGYQNAAFVELSILYWPITNATPDSFKMETFLIAPVAANVTDANSNARNSVKAVCDTTSAYRCSTLNASGQQGYFSIASALPGNITVSNYNFAINVQPRYASTHYKLTGYDSNGAAIGLSSNYAQIDVTAKVGNLYRRLKAQRLVKSTPLDNVFSSVVYSGSGSNNTTQRDICKNFAVVASGSNNYVVATANTNGAKPNCNGLTY